MINEHIAGDPVNEQIRWIKLTQQNIVQLMKEKSSCVSHNIVRKLLKKHKFVKRKMLSKRSCGHFEYRNEQFNIIHSKLKQHISTRNPVLSIDTKRKEFLGKIYRVGKVYCTQAIEVYDHTHDSLLTGTIVPHGIYDLNTQEAFMHIGKTHETAEFICDSLKLWWESNGKTQYPYANEIIIFCDAGGANSWRINVFKFELQRLCNELNLKISICHYPPYTSKWNPIEHRVFPHVSRTMDGLVLESHEQVQSLIAKTTTKTCLKVTARLIEKSYALGRVVPKNALDYINITYDENIPGLNYSVAPSVH